MGKTNVVSPQKSPRDSACKSVPGLSSLLATEQGHLPPSGSRGTNSISGLIVEYGARCGLGFLLAAAFLLRVVLLDGKSPHFDEGINGHFVAEMWRTGWYRYDPTNFHGPLYFYLLHFAEILLGKGVFAFRFITALLSTALVYVVWSHARYLGRIAIVGAVVVALSPAMVFFGRYAIHETLFVLCQVIFCYGFLKWRIEGGTRAVWYMLASTTAAIATKETFFIFTGTWMIAWWLTRLAERLWPTPSPCSFSRSRVHASGPLHEAGPSAVSLPSVLAPAPPTGGSRTWLKVSLCCAVVLAALFSGFFANPEGMRDMIRAYSFWTKTGTGATGHEKPFSYWFELLAIYEWPCLMALILTPLVCLFGSSSAWMRHFTLLGFGSWLAYSIIPYKTPWCILSVIWPLSFAFGFLIFETGPRVVSWLARNHQSKRTSAKQMKSSAQPETASGGQFARSLTMLWFGFPTLALLASAWVMLRLNFREFENPAEKYVYVQSTQDVPRVMSFLYERVRQHPEDLTMHIQVLNKDSWPFPWLLNRFTHVDFGSVTPETSIVADVIFADQGDVAAIEQKLSRRYWRRPLAIRDAYPPGHAYFDYDRFQGVIPASSEAVGPGQRGTLPFGVPPQDPSPALRGPATADDPGRATRGAPGQPEEKP